ncbi:S24 family peptidase [Candidatus Foliamicus sp.]
MNNDPVRRKIQDLLWERGLTMRQVSLAIGRNVSYMHGFLERGSPKVLSHVDSEKLAGVLECDVAALRHAERPPRGKPKAKERPTPSVTKQSPVPLAAISEVEVEVSAGPGALAQEFVEEKARWFLPEGMIRYEGGAVPGAVRALRVRGESMEPELSEGDRLLVDTSRRVPATGELFVLWDGGGLVVKRVEPLRDPDGRPRLRLKSANPDYADYTCLADEAHIVGKVLWTVRKV